MRIGYKRIFIKPHSILRGQSDAPRNIPQRVITVDVDGCGTYQAQAYAGFRSLLFVAERYR